MGLFLDAFWRAVAYCLHPRVIALSFLPLALMIVTALGLGYFYWEPALAWVRAALESSTLIGLLFGWLDNLGAGGMKSVIAPLLVIFTITPLIVVACLLLVAWMMTPAITALVAEKRFAQLERREGGSFLGSLAWSLGSTLLALVALVVSLPLWFVPPLILLLPPLIWGWLTYRVMAYDVLASHATRAERQQLFREHRGPLLAIGVLTGFIGAAPSLLWASGALFAVAFVLLVPLAIWIYTLSFAFAALWFAHYALAALARLRAADAPGGGPAASAAGPSSGVVVDAMPPGTPPSAAPKPALPGPDAHGRT